MGTYQAQYDGLTGEETVFGGTGLEKGRRKRGDPLLYPDLAEGTAGAVPEWGQSAKCFTTQRGSHSATLSLPSGGNYTHRAGRKCDRFHPTNGGIKVGIPFGVSLFLCGGGLCLRVGGAFRSPGRSAGCPARPREGSRLLEESRRKEHQGGKRFFLPGPYPSVGGPCGGPPSFSAWPAPICPTPVTACPSWALGRVVSQTGRVLPTLSKPS